MSYFRVCPNCGAHLDPGEVCDCLSDTVQEAQNLFPERFAGKTGREVVNEIARVVKAALGDGGATYV